MRTTANPNIDEFWMHRAIVLSRRGFPAPNPHVGCVLVAGTERVGEGWHRYAGTDHAEVMALKDAGSRARGATAYVTLEPCNHHGRTGPCSEALLQAGVARLVYACADSNPKAAGGATRLENAGVNVRNRVLEQEAYEANRVFLFSHAHQRPYIVLKAALSKDGFMGRQGEQVWLTSAPAIRAAHRLRAEMGAVLVGRGTVEIDNPRLTARIPGVRNQPIRIVIDPEAQLDKVRYDLFKDGAAPTWQVTRSGFGGDVLLASGGLHQLLHNLFDRGVRGLLVEGGPATLQAFWSAGLGEEVQLFQSPTTLGSGIVWDAALALLEGQVPNYQRTSSRKLGPDRQFSFRPVGLFGKVRD